MPVSSLKRDRISAGSGAPPELHRAERGEIEFLDLGMEDHGGVHGRHAGEHGDFFPRDIGERALGIETDVHHDLGAGGDRQQHDEGKAEDVEQRQHRQRLVLAVGHGVADPTVAHAHHGAEIGVGEHGALGLAGGAAGVLQHRHLVLERPMRVAAIVAVIGDELREIDLAAGAGDTLRRRAEHRVHRRRRQEILQAADDERLVLRRCP